MPKDNLIIAAIELGSSKVTGIIGKKDPDGAIHVMAAVQKPSSAFIRKGRIYNIPKTQSVIANIKEELENKTNLRIHQFYVGIGGMGLHTEINKVSRRFPERTEITTFILDSMIDENRQNQGADKVILESFPQEFKVGHNVVQDPVGVLSEHIEATYVNIVTKKETQDNVFKSINGVADLPITFLALANQMLTDPQRRSGCVFVDMGAETTSVAVFKNNLLRHLAVIPLGGKNITKDITSLQIEEDEAEQLKIQFGSATLPEKEENQKPIKLEVGDIVSFNEFNGLIEARQEEIIANIAEQIKQSNYDTTQLIGGIVITGGASKMRNLDKAFAHLTNFEKEKISFVKTIKTQVHDSKHILNENKQGKYNGVIALILTADQNCCSDLSDIESQTKFDEKKQEEEERRAQEEFERKKAEEARLAAEQEEHKKAEVEIENTTTKEEQPTKEKKNKPKFGATINTVKKYFNILFSSDEQHNNN